MTITAVFQISAFLSFIIAAANPEWPRPNLIGLGLAFFMLSLLVR